MKKADLYWLLAYPIYQLIGTFRHEASHALVAGLEGATIAEFVWWPTVRASGLCWGYVRWVGQTDWLTFAAPYFIDLITFSLFYILCLRVPFPARWIWLNAVILGVISPLINSLYNYLGRNGAQNDVGRLLEQVPPVFIHTYFLSTLAFYGGGLVWLFWRSNRSRLDKRRGRLSFDLI